MNMLDTPLKKLVSVLLTMLLVSCSSEPSKEAAQPPNLTPVLFVPGLGLKVGDNCDAKYFEEWKELNQLFEENKFSLKVACIPSGTIEDGAKALSEQLKTIFPSNEKKKFHIVAKSMGGLSTRLMLYNELSAGHSLSDQVISVTTISTPHRGSEIADMLTKGEYCTLPGKLLLPGVGLINKVTSPLLKSIGLDMDGLAEAGKALTTEHMACFNAIVKNDPNIKYFSFGYAIKCDDECQSKRKYTFNYPAPFYSMCWNEEIIKRKRAKKESDTENDGLVSVGSAKWGEYIATGEGEHFAETSKNYKYKGNEIWQDVFTKVIEHLKSLPQ